MSDILEADAFLSHYGVLGMHWGVRKEEPRVTEAQGVSLDKKKLNAALSVALGAAFLATAGVVIFKKPWMAKQAATLFDDALKKGANKTLDDFPAQELAVAVWSKNEGLMNHGILSPKVFEIKDISYPAGHTFYRLSSKAETTLSEKGLHSAYHVVDDLSDHRRYAALVDEMGIPGLSKYGDEVVSRFTVKVQAPHRIKIASPNTVLQIAREKGIEIPSNSVASFLRNKNLDGRFNVVRKELIKRGYNGVVDLDDFGSFAKMPVAFFKDTITRAKLVPTPYDKSAVPFTPVAIQLEKLEPKLITLDLLKTK